MNAQITLRYLRGGLVCWRRSTIGCDLFPHVTADVKHMKKPI